MPALYKRIGRGIGALTELEAYYNKFNEEKRLNSRHGQVEFITSMHYIHQCLEALADGKAPKEIRILDIGAGTGRYCIPLSEEGYDVTAVEPVRHNLGRLKKKASPVKAMEGNALKLSKLETESFDLTLLFGPMYHLHERKEKIQALSEAKRVTKTGGRILIAYIMNEYAVITYAFKERHIIESMKAGMLDENFRCLKPANPLYSMERLEDIKEYSGSCGLNRILTIAADGAANYMRRSLNALNEEEFQYFIQYHLATCERAELLGASAHIVDILQK